MITNREKELQLEPKDSTANSEPFKLWAIIVQNCHRMINFFRNNLTGYG